MLLLLHHPFLFKETNASSRRSKKNFWRHCRGGLRSSQDIPSTHHKLISIAFTLFASCLSFSSPPLHPCRFIRLFFALLPFELVLPCAFFLLASSLAKSLRILIRLLIFLRDPIMMNQLLVSFVHQIIFMKLCSEFVNLKITMKKFMKRFTITL